MAYTPTVTVQANWKRIVGKSLQWQSVLTSRTKIARVVITYVTGTYTTGGDVVDLSLGGKIKTIMAFIPQSCSEGYYVEYVPDATNSATGGKLRLRGDLNTATNAVGLIELSSASTLPDAAVVEAIILGF